MEPNPAHIAFVNAWTKLWTASQGHLWFDAYSVAGTYHPDLNTVLDACLPNSRRIKTGAMCGHHRPRPIEKLLQQLAQEGLIAFDGPGVTCFRLL